MQYRITYQIDKLISNKHHLYITLYLLNVMNFTNHYASSIMKRSFVSVCMCLLCFIVKRYLYLNSVDFSNMLIPNRTTTLSSQHAIAQHSNHFTMVQISISIETGNAYPI